MCNDAAGKPGGEAGPGSGVILPNHERKRHQRAHYQMLINFRRLHRCAGALDAVVYEMRMRIFKL